LGRTGYGRGIAAPQIGVPVRVVYLDFAGPELLINPVITTRSAETWEPWDACLSFSVEIFCKVRRAAWVEVTCQSPGGGRSTIRAESHDLGRNDVHALGVRAPIPRRQPLPAMTTPLHGEEPIARAEPLREAVYDRVVSRIRLGEFLPGDAVTEAGLSRSLQVSRTPRGVAAPAGGRPPPGFTLSADCRARVEDVWKLLFDPARFPQWWVGIETVRSDQPGEFTLWLTGYPDFPLPQKLQTDQANERVTISCQVFDIETVWQLAESDDGTSIHVDVSWPKDDARRLARQHKAIGESLRRLTALAEAGS
jgi:uncharacterized protein YndB with AHSA1/START domain